MAGVRCFELLGEMWYWLYGYGIERGRERQRERRNWRVSDAFDV